MLLGKPTLKKKTPARLSGNMISRFGFDQRATGKMKGLDTIREAIKRRFRPTLLMRYPPTMLPSPPITVVPSRSRVHWLRVREFT